MRKKKALKALIFRDFQGFLMVELVGIEPTTS